MKSASCMDKESRDQEATAPNSALKNQEDQEEEADVSWKQLAAANQMWMLF